MTAIDGTRTTVRSPFSRLLRFQTKRYWPVFASFWLFLGVVWSGLIAVLLRTDVLHDLSLWEIGDNAVSAPMVFLLVFGIIAVGVDLPILVAHGMTRRNVIATSFVGFAAAAVLFALLSVACYGLEAALFNAYGRDVEVSSPAGALPALLGELALMHLLYGAWGFLIGGLYFRYGGWVGTLLVIPSVIPVAVGEVVTGGGTPGSSFSGLGWLPPPAGAAAAGVATLVALTAGYLVVRDVPMRKISP